MTPRPMRESSSSISIYKVREEDGGVRELQAYFDQVGDLILSGSDYGPRTVALIGREEYEYWVRVPAVNVPQLLLELLKLRLTNQPAASSAFMKLLEEMSIPYGFSTWS